MIDVRSFSQKCEELACANGFEIETLCETESGPSIALFKGDESLPAIYLSAGMHGDEPAGPLAILECLQAQMFSENYRWLICPLLNPSGIAAETRETASGVDLNRDYLQRSTEEVRSHVSWLERQVVPRLFLSLHEDWESRGVYFYEINLTNRASQADRLLTAAETFFEREPAEIIDEHPVTEPGWIYHEDRPHLPEGWPEAIWMSKRGCPISYTFETPSSAALDLRVQCQMALIKEALHLYGEGLLCEN